MERLSVRVSGVEVFESSPWADPTANATRRIGVLNIVLLISGIEAFSLGGAVFGFSECQECYSAGRERYCTRWHPNASNLRHCIVRAKL